MSKIFFKLKGVRPLLWGLTPSLILVFFSSSLFATPILSSDSRFHPVVGKKGMVVTQEAIATEVGLSILKQGGNAIDAAVAVGFALAVTLPRAGNLGGGGFMMIYQAASKQVFALDYREKAPLLAKRDMFLDENGDADPKKSRNSILASGVPGTVKGLFTAHQKFGRLPIEILLAPAIRLAEEGFTVYPDLYHSLIRIKTNVPNDSAFYHTFYPNKGNPVEIGEVFKQSNLAATLKRISENGEKEFYKGKTAEKLIQYMKEQNGLISHEDLLKYKAVFRAPVKGTYKGLEIYSMPPPSSGGIHLIQMLELLEPFQLSQYGHSSSRSIHLMTEVMKRAYADRSKYLGDPDFSTVPIKELTSKKYLDSLRPLISLTKPTPSKEIQPGNPYAQEEHPETTHFSIIDSEGNAVSNTYTLNFSYGNKMMIPGTGIILNNEMDDFVSKPGVPNAYGLVGGKANAIQPEKRMLSSMSPTIVLKEKEPFLITGSPGGSRIITTVLQILLNVLEFNMNIQEATNAVRVHHQWLPDELRIEKDLNTDTVEILKKLGYKVTTRAAMGSAQSIRVYLDRYEGATDPRRPSGLAKGYN